MAKLSFIGIYCFYFVTVVFLSLVLCVSSYKDADLIASKLYRMSSKVSEDSITNTILVPEIKTKTSNDKAKTSVKIFIK